MSQPRELQIIPNPNCGFGGTNSGVALDGKFLGYIYMVEPDANLVDGELVRIKCETDGEEVEPPAESEKRPKGFYLVKFNVGKDCPGWEDLDFTKDEWVPAYWDGDLGNGNGNQWWMIGHTSPTIDLDKKDNRYEGLDEIYVIQVGSCIKLIT